MITETEFAQLRNSYIVIGKMVQKYGNNQYNEILKILLGQIRCIDSNEDVDIKTQYLVESYNRIFVKRGGLSDFIINDSNVEIRTMLNETFNNEIQKIWMIVKTYL